VKELIKIQESSIDGGIVKTVSARDLHDFLEVKKDFSDWIKDQIDRADLLQGIDFIIFPQKGEYGSRPKIEYYVTIDAGKNIAMMSGTTKGKEVRAYFIDCEKRLKSVIALPDFNNPVLAARAWADEVEAKQIAQTKAIELQKRIDVEKPKVEFAEAIRATNACIDVGVFAKLIGWGRNRLFQKMRQDGLLDGRNLPYQRYKELGVFDVDEGKSWKDSEGKEHIPLLTKITGKGQVYLAKRYRMDA
jgi:anti-repressor protein